MDGDIKLGKGIMEQIQDNGNVYDGTLGYTPYVRDESDFVFDHNRIEEAWWILGGQPTEDNEWTEI